MSGFLSAETIGRELNGRRTGSTWMARCPAHDDRMPSLSINDRRDGGVLVRCHAGCAQDAVIAALAARGLWNEVEDARHHGARQAPPAEPDQGAERRAEYALSIWRAAAPAPGTLAETYLRSRGLTIDARASLRFAESLKHPAGSCWPAMIALVRDGVTGAPIGIHRTFLARDGSGKAPVEPAKMMLGRCAGGAVRLAPLVETMMISEGIETALAAMQVSRRRAWAALSTSGLRALDLPAEVRDVIVLADGDDPGEAAAQAAAARWHAEGRTVRIARPPAGMDFADLVRAEGEAA